uniref:DUF676 domain-containing protein n=1 Tax=Globisporangium ultimum (strain ATCC 200006 / CBS 805.95 / DAOM BR144) TaxID=431595 RepID=K3WHW0_GLOUD
MAQEEAATQQEQRGGARLHAFLPRHIIVLVHGNNGAPTDFDAIESALVKKYGFDDILIIKSKVNHTQTSLGVEVGGSRLASEVYQEVFQHELHPDINSYKFSIIAHSLGGLYARFALVQLMESLSPLDIQYVSFVTICTPHLGSRRPRGDSTLKNVWRMGVHTVLATNALYGRTGVDLLIDSSSDDDNGSPVPPILETMTNPEFEYLNALKRFRSGTLVAMTDGDMLVPYASASIRNFNPYPSAMLTDKFTEWRWHVHHSGFTTPVETDSCPPPPFWRKLGSRVNLATITIEKLHVGVDVSTCERFQSVEGYDADNKQEVEFPYAMIQRLQQAIPWRRIDVTVEPCGVKGKFRIHDWPINKMQPPGCRADEFIDLLCEMVGHDHELEPLLEVNEDQRSSSNATPVDSSDDDTASRNSFGGPIINRFLEKFQKTTPSDNQVSSPVSAESSNVDDENQQQPRNSFFGNGMNRMREKFQKKQDVGSQYDGAQPSPSTSSGVAGKSMETESENTGRSSFGAMGMRFMEKFAKKETPSPAPTTAGTPTVSSSTTTSTDSFTTTSSFVAGRM